jgi:cytochrome c oxidase cbb3-type subunit 3
MRWRSGSAWGLMVMALSLAACGKEARTLTADLPQTPPRGGDDPRIPKYQDNAYQIAQGGRYFGWYGCGSCHAVGARGVLDLGDGRWRHGGGFDQVFGFIAHGHPGALTHYGDRIPTEQLWQITAYVRNLPQVPSDRRRRQDHDTESEPQGSRWAGAKR